jgi:hypothetical protein
MLFRPRADSDSAYTDGESGRRPRRDQWELPRRRRDLGLCAYLVRGERGVLASHRRFDNDARSLPRSADMHEVSPNDQLVVVLVVQPSRDLFRCCAVRAAGTSCRQPAIRPTLDSTHRTERYVARFRLFWLSLSAAHAWYGGWSNIKLNIIMPFR